MSTLICNVRGEHNWTSSRRTKSWWCKVCYKVSVTHPFEEEQYTRVRADEPIFSSGPKIDNPNIIQVLARSVRVKI